MILQKLIKRKLKKEQESSPWQLPRLIALGSFGWDVKFLGNTTVSFSVKDKKMEWNDRDRSFYESGLGQCFPYTTNDTEGGDITYM